MPKPKRKPYLRPGETPEMNRRTMAFLHRGRKARGSISLIVKGPVKSARRAAARHGLATASCRTVGTGEKFGDVQCYATCKPSTNRAVAQWYGERSASKAGRGFPPGTLLYHGAFCSEYPAGKLSGAGKTRKRRKR